MGHCSAACSPILSHVGAHCCVSEGKSGGGSEGRLCGLSGWFSTFPTADEEELQPDQPQRVGLGHTASLGREEGEGLRQPPKEAGTRCPQSRHWERGVLRSFRVEEPR